MADQIRLQPSRSPATGLRLFTSRLPLSTELKTQNPEDKAPCSFIPGPLNPLTPARRLRARAFSLVELLAVVGIIAILSVATVPVMRGLGGSQSSRATAQILVSALEQTRTTAILSGTNAYLVLPDASFPTAGYAFRSYAIIRNTIDQDSSGSDDFQTNVPASSGWVLVSKWERLPGDLLFSSNLLTVHLTNRISPTGIPTPGNASAGNLPWIGFAPGGGLLDSSGTNGLLFASSNKVVDGKAAVADRIEISLYSGRVRYAGLTNNVEF